jgi:outer membrane protein TolC
MMALLLVCLALPYHSKAALHLSDVLTSVESHYPELRAAAQEVLQAEGQVRSADGAFDITWKSKWDQNLEGYYKNTYLDSVIEKPTKIWGTRLFAGYRRGRGDFAIYDNYEITNRNGEWRAGILLPLLRDGFTDKSRAMLYKSRAQLDEFKAGQYLTMLRNTLEATDAYWSWVANGQKLQVARDLLKVAETRNEQLIIQVKKGDLAKIVQLDNERAILQRRAALVAADRAFMSAQYKLSLYLRNATGQPRFMPESEVPKEFPPLPDPKTLPVYTLDEAQANRPELKAIDATDRGNLAELSLAKNQILPKLNVQLSASRDVGNESVTRERTELEGVVSLEIPIEFNVAAGAKQSALAKQQQIELKRQLTKDKISAEIKDAHVALQTTLEQALLAASEAALALQLEKGERLRWQQGDSNLIFVNIREQQTAEAAIRRIDSSAAFFKALAGYSVAAGLKIAPPKQ